MVLDVFAKAGSTIGYEHAVKATWFTVDTGAFQSTTTGSFPVARGDRMSAINASGNANELTIVSTAMPEPGTLVLAGIVGILGAW